MKKILLIIFLSIFSINTYADGNPLMDVYYQNDNPLMDGYVQDKKVFGIYD